MLSSDELLLQIAILAEICIKMRFFIEKLQIKSPRAGGLAPRPPCLRRLPPNPPLRIPGYATAPHRSFNAEYQAGKLRIPNFKSFGPTRRGKLRGCAR